MCVCVYVFAAFIIRIVNHPIHDYSELHEEKKKASVCVRNGSDSPVYYCPSPEPLINNADLLDFHFGRHTQRQPHWIPLAFIHHLITSYGFFPSSLSLSHIQILLFFISFTPFYVFGAAHVSQFFRECYLLSVRFPFLSEKPLPPYYALLYTFRSTN